MTAFAPLGLRQPTDGSARAAVDGSIDGVLSLIDILNDRLINAPDQPAFQFLPSRPTEPVAAPLTWTDLARRVADLAEGLHDRVADGDRVALLFEPSLNFVVAFLACFVRGVVAVPVYPPTNRRYAATWHHILADCTARLALTDDRTCGKLSAATIAACPTFNIDALTGRSVGSGAPTLRRATQPIAYLQYTSGSTSQPKGVVVTHDNILANTTALAEVCGFAQGDRIFSWLPLYHDMGLVGGVFQPIFSGVPVVLAAPLHFARAPLSWLETITRNGITHTGGPNSAFKRLLDACRDVDLTGIDLRRLKVWFNGSEPIDGRTCASFEARFARHGLRADALMPCYGLAEATLFVAAGRFDSNAEVAGRPPSCGRPSAGHAVWIAAEGRLTPLPDGQAGEIIVAGPSVAAGYWQNPAHTAACFPPTAGAAGLPAAGERCLRTGDIGMRIGGQLHVLGRLKDLLIVNGRNIYPQDVEAGIALIEDRRLHGQFCACFAASADDADGPVVVCETQRGAAPAELGALRAKVAEAVLAVCGVQARAVVLTATGALPRTANGKIQRSRARELYRSGSLADLVAPVAPSPAAPAAAASRHAADAAIAWLDGYAATRINSVQMRERRSIPPHILLDFAEHGLMGLQASPSIGGLGLSCEDSLRVQARLAAIDPTLAAMIGVHNVLALRPVAGFAQPAATQRYLRRMAEGRCIGAFALTEGAAGSAPARMASIARPVAGGWRLHGRKRWIGNAAWSGVIVAFARIEAPDARPDGPQPGGVTAFLVDPNAPGVTMGPEALTMGVNAMIQNDVILDGVFVAQDMVLGRPGDGILIAQDAMMTGRLGIGAIALGAMRRALQVAHVYAEAREIGPDRLGRLETTRHVLGGLAMDILVLEAALQAVARQLDAGLKPADEVYAAVKFIAGQWSFAACDAALQVLGARGYMEANPMVQLVADTRLLRIFEGPSETMADFIGQRLMSGSQSAGLTRLLASAEQACPALAAGYLDALARLHDHSGRQPPHGQPRGALVEQAAGRLGALCIIGVLAAPGLVAAATEAELPAAAAERLATHLASEVALWGEGARSAAWRRSDRLISAALAGQAAVVQTAAFPQQAVDQEIGVAWPVAARPPPAAEVAVPAATDRAHPARRPGAARPPVPPGAIADYLRAWFADIVGHAVDPQCGIADLGIDSLHVMTLLHDLETRFGVQVSEDTILAGDRVADLAARLEALRIGEARHH